MNSTKEPEPGPRLRALHSGMGHEAGRIWRMVSREGEEYVQGIEVEEFVGG
jgi:uncharacterized protein (DUF736 family)